ncbi:MAG: lamin tail domain-containing protein [Dokdonella sp.]
MNRIIASILGLCSSANASAQDFVFFAGFESQLQPVAGSVIVDEIMSNPELVADNVGEWFEFTNVSTQSVELNNCLIGNGTTQNTLPAHSLSSGGYAVMARNLDTSTNGGVSAFASFTFSLPASGTIILTCGSRSIDQVSWTSELAGHSRSLDPAHLDAIANDNPANWCFSTMLFNASDFGTPNFVNESCPP